MLRRSAGSSRAGSQSACPRQRAWPHPRRSPRSRAPSAGSSSLRRAQPRSQQVGRRAIRGGRRVNVHGVADGLPEKVRARATDAGTWQLAVGGVRRRRKVQQGHAEMYRWAYRSRRSDKGQRRASLTPQCRSPPRERPSGHEVNQGEAAIDLTLLLAIIVDELAPGRMRVVLRG